MLHIQFIPEDSVAAFLASKAPVQRAHASTLLGDAARLAQIKELQRQRNASEADSFFPSGTPDNALFAQYQQQVRETGNPPHPSAISPETRAMLDRLRAKQQQDAREKQMLENSRLNEEAIQQRRRQCSRDIREHQQARDRKVEEEQGQHRALVAEKMAARRLEEMARQEELCRLKEMHEITARHNAMLKEQVETQDLLRRTAEVHEARQTQMDKVIKERGEEIAAKEAQDLDSNQCILCMENPKNIVAIPCGHIAVCQQCSTRSPTTCSICRRKVQSWVQVFNA